MARLLSCLVGPGTGAARSVQRLQFKGLLQPDGLVGCTQLRRLRELHWVHRHPYASDAECHLVWAALLQASPCLTRLELEDLSKWKGSGAASALPACLVNYRGLTQLRLLSQGLSDMPAGNYLAGECCRLVPSWPTVAVLLQCCQQCCSATLRPRCAQPLVLWPAVARPRFTQAGLESGRTGLHAMCTFQHLATRQAFERAAVLSTHP